MKEERNITVLIRWRTNDRELKTKVRERLGISDTGESLNGHCRWRVTPSQLEKLRLIAVKPYDYLQIMGYEKDL